MEHHRILRVSSLEVHFLSCFQTSNANNILFLCDLVNSAGFSPIYLAGARRPNLHHDFQTRKRGEMRLIASDLDRGGFWRWIRMRRSHSLRS